MEYREKLLEFIMEGRRDEMAAWITSHDDLDRLDIMNEFKELMEELAEESGMDLDDDLDELDAAVTNYQEKILDEQLASLKEEMQERIVEEKMQELEVQYNKLRQIIIDSILTEPDNVADLRKMALEIMETEKEHGFYDEENWKQIL